MTTLELVPDSWDSDRDEAFFRITAHLLARALVEAASALLASYDDEAAASPYDVPRHPVSVPQLPPQAAVRGSRR